MAPRKHEDEPKQRDKTMMAWRGAVTSFLITITTLLGMLMQRIGTSPDTNQIQASLDRIGNRITTIESTVQSLTIEVRVVRGIVDGMKRPQHL